MSFDAFSDHVAAYELSGLEPQARPPEALAKLVQGAATVFASDAARVADSLARLGISADVTRAAFREAPPRAPALPGHWPEIVWLAAARARGALAPAFADARRDLARRAADCCDALLDATPRGDVALVGHGWFNGAVAKALAARGWRRSGGPGFRRPWGHLLFLADSPRG